MRKGKLFLFLSFAVLVGCNENIQVKKKERSVKVAKVESLDKTMNKLTLPATINERRRVDLAFRVGGPLINLNNIIGSYVEKGQIIAHIDNRDFIVGLSKAESNYKLAEAEYNRYKMLLSQESVSKSLFDKIEAQYILAKGNYEDAKNALEDTQLKAPFTGYIDMVYVENYEKVNPGQPIVSFLDLSTYKVNAWISVNDARSIDVNTSFSCVISDKDSTYHINAKLLELGSKSNFTKQSYPISTVIEAPKGVKLRAGMTAQLQVYKSNDNNSGLCVVPVTSVFSKGEKSCVWVLNNSKVTKRMVDLGQILSTDEIVVKKGLKESEVVITAGVNYLQEGEKVKIYKGFSSTNKGNQL
ncbi:efflux RND transporter periplasmic adaptor subunit [Plebeiibacterium marinum]|uniref:Efflux RND transporter periplasmic adaptor subunit n=1 Tax=Plebeiibacterium marinum TaxID=2992111 RepID=A0AAE3MCB7_9BACT|nr:efflux RND transporter periplasmic adaptor subunit [Plebeiobacterium marinum]MCW3805308.1 efflux RND transporter periplasmic adaptor subunit [Plebeiobacterium marinum]